MATLKKALVWAYGDSLRYIAFLVLAFVFVAGAMVFITYPWQTILTLLGVVVFYGLICVVTEWK